MGSNPVWRTKFKSPCRKAGGFKFGYMPFLTGFEPRALGNMPGACCNPRWLARRREIPSGVSSPRDLNRGESGLPLPGAEKGRPVSPQPRLLRHQSVHDAAKAIRGKADPRWLARRREIPSGVLLSKSCKSFFSFYCFKSTGVVIYLYSTILPRELERK